MRNIFRNDKKLTGTLVSWFDGRLASMTDEEIFAQMPLITGGSKQSWSEALVTAPADGASLASSTTRTSILPAPATFTLPANFFDVGKVVKITACGRLSNVVTTPGTLTLDVGLGANVVWTSGAQALSTTAHTTLPFWLEIMLTCTIVGASTTAKLMGQGRMTAQPISNTQVADADTLNIKTLLLPNTTPAVGAGFDSTVANAVTLNATHSVSNAGTNILLHQFLLEAKN